MGSFNLLLAACLLPLCHGFVRWSMPRMHTRVQLHGHILPFHVSTPPVTVSSLNRESGMPSSYVRMASGSGSTVLDKPKLGTNVVEKTNEDIALGEKFRIFLFNDPVNTKE
jgi:hypothetical protein